MPRAVTASLVLPHHPHRPEPDPLVGVDRAQVLRRRVDGQPMVPPHLEQVPRGQSDRLGAQAVVGQGRSDRRIRRVSLVP